MEEQQSRFLALLDNLFIYLFFKQNQRRQNNIRTLSQNLSLEGTSICQKPFFFFFLSSFPSLKLQLNQIFQFSQI